MASSRLLSNTRAALIGLAYIAERKINYFVSYPVNLVNTPHQIEVFVRFKMTDGNFNTMIGFIDTGAEISLLPIKWLEIAEHKVLERDIVIEQAGLSGQSFEAVEAEITLYFEDLSGNASKPMKVRAWFAETKKVIIGFRDILEHAKLYIDYQETRTGWIEI